MKQFLSLGILSLLCSTAAVSSTQVCIDYPKNEIQLRAHYYFYGKDATRERVLPCVQEINRQFSNGTKIQLNGHGPRRTVVAKVRFTIVTEAQAIELAARNHLTKNNFVRLDTPPKKSRITMSEHGLNKNYGYFMSENHLGESTTCTHEFAHGLGLVHLPDPCDWKGKGSPPIMAPRGCRVDKQYQYSPTEQPGHVGATINPKFRTVHPSEIASIKLGDLKFRVHSVTKDCASQGKVSNRIYRRDGTYFDR